MPAGVADSAAVWQGARPRRRLNPWRSFWRRAPRQLVTTTAGKWLLLLTVACGLLAVNSGNNLLFFVWGLELGTLLISGLLSEASLRPLALRADWPPEARVGMRCHVRFALQNLSSRRACLGVQVVARVAASGGEHTFYAPFALRLEKAITQGLPGFFVPAQRGALRLVHLSARTAYPFGLFIKQRRFACADGPAWVWPAQLPCGQLADAVAAAVGERPLARAGAGEEFFALRGYRDGDLPARVHWRRAAAGTAWTVREQALQRAEQVTFVLAFDVQGLLRAAHAPPPQGVGTSSPWAQAEQTLALAASLMEQLLARGLGVGLCSHGLAVAAAAGPAQRKCLLDAAAALPLQAPATLAPVVLPPAAGQAVLQLVGPMALAPFAQLPRVHLDPQAGVP